ncbi:MAG: hypothetical protein NTV34_04855 [Proteobacteria bacterium]|nr:hypothetical protein [Pseudomonadota bacterium]
MFASRFSRNSSTALIILCGVAASAARAQNTNTTKESIQQTFYELTGKDTATLKFEKGSSKLSAANEAELKTMFNAVRDNAKVKEIMVLAYSDLDYPANQKSDLPNRSKVLADKRGKTVSSKLQEFGALKLKIISMATKSSWFDKAFVTKEAQVKQEAVAKQGDADFDDVFYEALGARLRTSGGPGSVIVVIRHDGPYKN